MSINKVLHVKSEISTFSSRLNPIDKNQGIFICCPYHAGGRENTPSCKVNLTSTSAPVGYFYCFSCSEKGSWNKLAATVGMKSFNKSDQINDIYSFSIKRETARKYKELENYKKLQLWNKREKWRSITTRTLRRFGARISEDERYQNDYELYLPVTVHNQYVGGIYCRKYINKKLKKLGFLSYINTKGSWTKQNLFGFDIAYKKRGPLWVVEGPRDALKVSQLGGRVVAILGSYFGKEKARLIEQLDPPYIIWATDPDEAGDKAYKSATSLLDMIPIHRVEFPPNKDPAKLNQRSYDKCIRIIRKARRNGEF